MALSENVERAVYTDRSLVVMPAVVGWHPFLVLSSPPVGSGDPSE